MGHYCLFNAQHSLLYGGVSVADDVSLLVCTNQPSRGSRVVGLSTISYGNFLLSALTCSMNFPRRTYDAFFFGRTWQHAGDRRLAYMA